MSSHHKIENSFTLVAPLKRNIEKELLIIMNLKSGQVLFTKFNITGNVAIVDRLKVLFTL